MTERLYHTDCYLREFTARVVEWTQRGDRRVVVLDRSAFYPTAGGQPHDIGVLWPEGSDPSQGVPVVEVLEEGDAIFHVLGVPLEADRVAGRVDWEHRFDYMQQHTGQHLLSQAFLRVLAAETSAVHLGAEVCTLDLALPALSPEEVERVEDLANAVVWEDRPVRIFFTDQADLPALGLRRPPKVSGRVRIVEIEGFDRSACGGTHVRAAGAVGPVKIRRSERFKEQVRVQVLCGQRAFNDYRWKHAIVADLAGRLTTGDREVGAVVARLLDESRERERVRAELVERLLAYEARDLLAGAEECGGFRLVRVRYDHRDANECRVLAAQAIALDRCVVIIGVSDGGKVVAARAAGVEVDMGALVRRLCQAYGGTGGGRPEMAQGAIPEAALLDDLLVRAAREIREG
ncbi:MAG: hypothetical protein HY660_07870 [Armatimonadetes bacterium]|nr:hypothetical protein [Armatimonadota bacterium]